MFGGITLILLVVWLTLPGTFCAMLASSRNREQFGWFIAGMLVPVVAHITVAGLPPIARWSCPACGGSLPAKDVKVCMNCGHHFKANGEQSGDDAPKDGDEKSESEDNGVQES